MPLAPCRLVLEAAAPSLYRAMDLVLLELEPHLAALKTTLGWEDTVQEGVCPEALRVKFKPRVEQQFPC